ncbi:hypothetical protein GCM10010435_05210 [Winogradskya consettensis]|uniref:Protein kinase domain-containing protein n=1 Tax=Winogradskya consettensis TaxID=113560 RepID=A0A919SY65_9ACTN|nr:hypothetical protein [Actinoplanes consettensis]GIM79566.1 hypothetical protein Aco04nite_66160 [Actinoplanes consettensis]
MGDDLDADLAELDFFDPRQVRIDPGGNATLRWCRYRGQQYLFKEFTPEHLSDVHEDALVRLLRWRESRSGPDRERLDVLTAWPRHTVRGDGRLAGLLIPAADSRFFAAGRHGLRTPRSLSDLPGASPGMPAPHLTFAILGHVILAVRWLHGQGVVVNDLQNENVLFAADPVHPAVYVVDCDSMVSGREWGQVASPAAPDLMDEVMPTVSIPTTASDLTKLMWTVVRVLLEVPNLTGLGQDDRAVLAAVAPAGTRDLLLAVVDHPADGPAWDRLAEQWSRLTGEREAPVTLRSGWLPPGYSYRPDPGPPVLPARLLPGYVASTARGRVAMLAVTAMSLIGITSVVFAVILGLRMGDF